MKHLALLAVATLIAATGPASGAALNFADGSWSAGDGATSTDFDTDLGQVTISAMPAPAVTTFSANGAAVGCGGDCAWWQDDNLIDAHEILLLEFEDGVYLSDATFHHLGIETYDTVFGDFTVWEIGLAETDESLSYVWGTNTGVSTVAFNEEISYLRISSTFWSDFSLYSLEGHRLGAADYSGGARPIPEPEAAVLFPIGALIVGYAIRRQRRATA